MNVSHDVMNMFPEAYEYFFKNIHKTRETFICLWNRGMTFGKIVDEITPPVSSLIPCFCDYTRDYSVIIARKWTRLYPIVIPSLGKHHKSGDTCACHGKPTPP